MVSSGKNTGVPEEHIEDHRDFWWVPVDLAVLRDKGLSPSAKLVYATLCTFTRPGCRSAFPSVATLADQAGISERQVWYALKELVDGGWAQKKSRRGAKGECLSTVYHLVGHRRKDEAEYPVTHEDTVHPVHPPSAPCAGGGCTTCTTPPAHGAGEVRDKDKDRDKDKKITGPSDLGEEIPPPQTPPAAEEESLGPQDAPEAMRETVELFLAKTRRPGISPGELSAVRALEGLHTPHRVQREISTAMTRFERTGRTPGSLTLEYIYEALKHQRSGSKRVTRGASEASPDPVKRSRLAELDVIRKEREEAWEKQLGT